MEQKRLRDYIDIAIQREEEAHEFYRDLRARVTDPVAKDALDLLAREELKHKDFLVSYRDGGYRPDALKMSSPIDYKIAEHLDKPDAAEDLKGADAYLLAAHRELSSYRFYTTLADIHPQGELKDMFKKMASEELRHKEKVEYLYSNAAYPQTNGG